MGCLLIAAGLRIWGLNYGLPFLYHPDEGVPVIKAQTMLRTGDLNPHFFHWPSLIFYINALAYGLHYLIGNILGVFHTVADIPVPIMLAMGSGKMPAPEIWLLSRAISMIFGLGVVVLVFLSSKELTGKLIAGAIAGLLLAVSPTNVALSRYIAPDVMATFLIMLSFYGSIKVWKTGHRRYYILAGVAAGLAISAKYNAALILVTLVLAHFWRYGLKGIKKKDFYLTLFLTVITFFATTPYSLLDFSTFLTDIQFDRQHYSTGHTGMEGDTLNWYLSYMWRVEGLVFILAIIEIVRGVFMRAKNTLFLSFFPIIYFVFISSFIVRNERTLLLILPFVVLLATNLIIWALIKLSEQKNPKVSTGFVIGIALIITIAIAFPLQKTIRNNVKLTSIDSRETARIWIADNLPHESKIAIEAYAPYIDPSFFTIKDAYFWREDHSSLEWYQENNFDYWVFSEGSYGRYFKNPEKYGDYIAAYEELWNQFHLEKSFNDGDYEIRIYSIPK